MRQDVNREVSVPALCILVYSKSTELRCPVAGIPSYYGSFSFSDLIPSTGYPDFFFRSVPRLIYANAGLVRISN